MLENVMKLSRHNCKAKSIRFAVVCERYSLVITLSTLSVLHLAAKNFDTNWEPSSVNSFDWILQLAMQCSKKILATAVAFIVCVDMTFVNLVFLSVMTATS